MIEGHANEINVQPRDDNVLIFVSLNFNLLIQTKIQILIPFRLTVAPCYDTYAFRNTS